MTVILCYGKKQHLDVCQLVAPQWLLAACTPASVLLGGVVALQPSQSFCAALRCSLLLCAVLCCDLMCFAVLCVVHVDADCEGAQGPRGALHQPDDALSPSLCLRLLLDSKRVLPSQVRGHTKIWTESILRPGSRSLRFVLDPVEGADYWIRNVYYPLRWEGSVMTAH